MDEAGNYKSMERFLPDVPFAGPMDMQFGPDGALYILEYGKGWFRQNNDSKLVKLEYNAGNRVPVASVTADKVNGAVPLTVKLSAAGSKDFDKDVMRFEWTIESSAGDTRKLNGISPVVTFEKAGVNTVLLTVTDAKGASASQSITINAGNDEPKLTLELTKGNSSFFFPDQEIEYKVYVKDLEDGSLANGDIPAEQVSVNMNYSSEGFTYPLVGQPTAEQRGIGIKGGMIINSNDCYHCHSINLSSIGPTFTEIAERYKDDETAPEKLARKVITGGGGKWGTVSMSAHPELPMDDAKKMIDFILNLRKAAPKSMPVTGKHKIKLPQRLSARGVYVLHASYKDKGANGIGPVTGEHAIVLQPPWILPSQANTRKGGMNVKVPNPKGQVEILRGNGSFIAFNNIDLTGITQIEIAGEGNGTIEIRIDSASGKLIGSLEAAAIKKSDPEIMKGGGTKIKIVPTKGSHDLYFVVNGKAFSIKNYIKFLQ
jgi:cytochrome c